MTKQMGKTIVPDELYNRYVALRRSGGKCFLATAEPSPYDDCTNCHGGGVIVYQWVVGGPFDVPQNCRGEGKEDPDGSFNVVYNDVWYLARSRGYKCPVCRGGKAIPKQPTKRYKTKPVIDNVLEGMI